VHDQLATGTKLRALTIVDTFSRFSPAIEPRFNFRGADVMEVLERVGRVTGFPAAIRVDQGSEFVSRDLDLWAYQRGVTLDFSRPGKPTDNAYAESFNATVRLECLGRCWFLDLDDACEKVEEWWIEYNGVRPHSAIGHRTPLSLISLGNLLRRPQGRRFSAEAVQLLGCVHTPLEKAQHGGPTMGSGSRAPAIADQYRRCARRHQ